MERSQSFQNSLSKAAKKFDEMTSRRERLIKESRDVISLAAKVIVSIHTSNQTEARRLLKQARDKLDELRRVAAMDLSRYLVVPEQEYVEASVFYSISTGEKMPSIEELGVGPASYILGLLDLVGELKRAVYDNIRLGRIKEAEEIFSAMEALYTQISPFAVYDNIAQGVKRKLDIARMLIEDTRSIVTEEVRRTQFMKSVNELTSRLKKQGISGNLQFAEERAKPKKQQTLKSASLTEVFESAKNPE
jgi:translin